MTFHEDQFPPNISFGATGGPAFNTEVVTVRSGREQRNRNWSEMRHRYDVSQGVKSEADFEVIRAHFLAMGGKADGFRFKDWADHHASITDGHVVALSSTTFQLVKRYSHGSTNVDREITKPIAAGFTVTVSGSPAAFSLDSATGILTIVAAPSASNVRWSGEFDVPVRYDTDELQASITNKHPTGHFWISWDSIPLIETRDIT